MNRRSSCGDQMDDSVMELVARALMMLPWLKMVAYGKYSVSDSDGANLDTVQGVGTVVTGSRARLCRL